MENIFHNMMEYIEESGKQASIQKPSNPACLSAYCEYFQDVEEDALQFVTFSQEQQIKYNVKFSSKSGREPQAFLREVFRGGTIAIFDVIQGPFNLELKMFVIPTAAPKIKKIGQGSFGNICEVQGHKMSVSKRFKLTKKQKLIQRNAMNKGSFLQTHSPLDIKQAVLECSLAKICSMLGIGPQYHFIMGFDLILFDDCIQFYMEKCSKYDDRPANLSFEEIELSLKKRVRGMHMMCLVHKDIKPPNVLYSPSKKELVLCDFGISDFLTEKHGWKSLTFQEGTKQFMSEQMRNIQYHQNGWVDMYYNDMHSLRKTLSVINIGSPNCNIKEKENAQFANSLEKVANACYNLYMCGKCEEIPELNQYSVALIQYFPEFLGQQQLNIPVNPLLLASYAEKITQLPYFLELCEPQNTLVKNLSESLQSFAMSKLDIQNLRDVNEAYGKNLLPELNKRQMKILQRQITIYQKKKPKSIESIINIVEVIYEIFNSYIQYPWHFKQCQTLIKKLKRLHQQNTNLTVIQRYATDAQLQPTSISERAHLFMLLMSQKIAFSCGKHILFVKLLLQASKDSDKLDGQDGLVECEETALTEGTFWGYPVYEIQWFGVGDQAQLWRTQQQDILRWNNQQMAQLAEQNRLYQQQLYAQMNDIEEEEDLLRQQALRQQQELLLQQQSQIYDQEYQQQQQQLKQQEAKKQTQLREEALRLKAEEQRRLEAQRKAKEQEAARQREIYLQRQQEIQKQKEQEINRIIDQQRKAEEQRILQQQKANDEAKRREQEQLNKDQEIQRRIQEQRELLKKSLDEQKKNAAPTVGPTQNNIDTSKLRVQKQMSCPSELLPIFNDLVARKVNFIDSSFPPKLETIGPSDKVSSNMSSSVWLRPSQIFKQGVDYQLFDGINPCDIKQGSLGVCYYLSAIASLAERDWRITSLFPFFSKEFGFYVVRLLVHGKPTNIAIDDFIPCSRGSKEPLFSKPNGRQIWVMMLEKAWVKNFGTYLSAEAMSPHIMMEDLTMAPGQGVWIKNIAKQFKTLKTYDDSDYILVLTSVADKAPKGIVGGHAYSLLSVYEEGNVKLFKIRNPWGHFQWEGCYGAKSERWTPELSKKVEKVDADDGVFFMTPQELVLGFNYYSVSMVREKYFYSFTELSTGSEEDAYFTFSLQKQGAVNLRLTQPFDRLLNDKSYKYSSLVFEFGRIDDSDNVTFLGQGNQQSVFGAKSIHMHNDVYLDLKPGNYFVRLRILWNSTKYRSAVLAAYAPETITFTRCDVDAGRSYANQGLKYWKNTLRSMLADKQKGKVIPGMNYSQKWVKGQYILYAENITDKNYELTVTFDSKKFKNCRLGLNKANQTQVKMQMKAKGGWNICTVEKTSLNAECFIGSFNFQVKVI